MCVRGHLSVRYWVLNTRKRETVAEEDGMFYRVGLIVDDLGFIGFDFLYLFGSASKCRLVLELYLALINSKSHSNVQSFLY